MIFIRKNNYSKRENIYIFVRLREYLHEISFRVKWNIFNLVSGQSLINVYIAAVVLLKLLCLGRNFFSGDKCHVNTSPKWNDPKGNICLCEYFIKTKIADQKIKMNK